MMKVKYRGIECNKNEINTYCYPTDYGPVLQDYISQSCTSPPAKQECSFEKQSRCIIVYAYMQVHHS